jgi:fibronectin type 3 domain-containing protein
MKKSGLLTAVLCICLGAAMGCEGEKDNKKNSSLLGALTSETGGGGETILPEGPASVTATDGTHTDRVGINWETVEGAVSYKVYRSETNTGPFESIGAVPASDLNKAVIQIAASVSSVTGIKSDIATPGTGSPQAVFQSDVDLNVQNEIFGIPTYRGVMVLGGFTCKIRIIIGDSINTVVEFSGHTLGSYYTQDEVVDMINAAVGKTVCYPVDDGDKKYVKIVSTEGRITLENANDPLIYIPLKHLLKKDAASGDVITAEPVPVDDGDDDPPVPQPQPVYYFTDSTVVTGTHYYYAVTAVMEDGTESNYSPVDEGFALDASAPGKVNGVSATDGTYPDRVTVTWQAVDKATLYRVFRINCKKVTVQVGGDIAGTSFDDTTVPAGEFNYKVIPFSGTVEGVSSDPVKGYRAVTDEEFFAEFMYSINYTSKRLKHFGALGEDTITAENSSGTCHYKASMNGVADITYVDYCDLYMTLNGSQHTVITDLMSQNGILKDCKINVTGVYTGYVRYDLVIKGGKPGGGYYYVSQNGGPETRIPYNNQ